MEERDRFAIRAKAWAGPATIDERDMMTVPMLNTDQLRTALLLWAQSIWTTADIAVLMGNGVTEAAVANSIGRFHGFTQGRSA